VFPSPVDNRPGGWKREAGVNGDPRPALGAAFLVRQRGIGRLVAGSAVILVLSSLAVILPTGSATATTCPGTQVFGFLANTWLPSDGNVWGFRAPINLRKGSHSGSVCIINGSGDIGHADVWVGIEGAGAISQIGWTHDGSMGYCRFYEWFTTTQGIGPLRH
jgi:hypothetical protein